MLVNATSCRRWLQRSYRRTVFFRQDCSILIQIAAALPIRTVISASSVGINLIPVKDALRLLRSVVLDGLSWSVE